MKAVFETMFPMIDKAILEHYFDDGLTAFETSFSNTLNDEIDIDPFLNDLIQMKTDKASQSIIDQIKSGMDIETVYLDILQPTMYKVGSLWQRGIIGVAKEHYITAAIQHIIGQMYPYLFAKRGIGRYSLTAVCAGAELHEIGMRMVADMFELSGWDTYFLGSNLPPEMILAQLKSAPTTVLAVSATTPSHLLEVEELIRIIRFDKQLASIKIIVGGRAFNETPDVWKLVGADGFAADARSAIGLANRLVGAIE